MKNLVLRLCRWGLTILGINCIISCDGDDHGTVAPMYGVQVAEYGVPVIEYRISGKVVDSRTESPVQGIAVTRIDDNPYIDQDTVRTSINGEFVYCGECFPTESMTLGFIDTDGKENTDDFKTQKAQVKLAKIEDDKGTWHWGVYGAEGVTIKLEPKSEND